MAGSLLRRNKLISLLGSVKKADNFANLTSNRTIMTSRARLEKAVEELQKNPYFDKYAQKIAKLQQTSPEEFLSRMEEKAKQEQEKKERWKRENQFQATQAKPQPLADPGSQTKPATLDSIMKIELIENKNKEEITQIWHEYHKQKDCICGVLTKDQFEKMFERGKKYSTFLLPLPRDNGYEFIVIQFHGTEVHMTPLLWFQTHKENAPECLTMIHYTELMDSKGIVLMKGEYDIKALTVAEAQCLANELQMYYCSDHAQRLNLLKLFTERPDEFKHMDLVAHLETISFDAGASGELLSKKTKK